MELPAETIAPAIGSAVQIVPNHVCAAINLADEIVVVSEATAVGRWHIAARGLN